MAQGEYVAPEKIENILSARCNLNAQLFVHGESLESSLVAIAVPDPETFIPFAMAIVGSSNQGGSTTTANKDIVSLCQDPKVKVAYLQELEKAGKAGGLRGFEFVKAVHLTTDMFSIENGLLTPTLKVKRPQVKEHFTEQIKAMYNDLRATTPVAKL